VDDAQDGLVNRIDKVGTMSRAASLDLVAQLRYIASMKTATIPSVRVEPEFRAEVESVLAEGESLSEFVEASVRASVERRRVQAEFIARGLRSRDEAKRTGDYVDADDVVTALQRKLDAARARLAKPPKTRQ
jgi:Arc/MetJ-type ribon-helix-helix transcriptional regulator